MPGASMPHSLAGVARQGGAGGRWVRAAMRAGVASSSQQHHSFKLQHSTRGCGACSQASAGATRAALAGARDAAGDTHVERLQRQEGGRGAREQSQPQAGSPAGRPAASTRHHCPLQRRLQGSRRSSKGSPSSTGDFKPPAHLCGPPEEAVWVGGQHADRRVGRQPLHLQGRADVGICGPGGDAFRGGATESARVAPHLSFRCGVGLRHPRTLVHATQHTSRQAGRHVPVAPAGTSTPRVAVTLAARVRRATWCTLTSTSPEGQGRQGRARSRRKQTDAWEKAATER